MIYELDPSGTSPNNKIVDEIKVITPPTRVTDSNFVVPNITPFHKERFEARLGTRVLVEGVDYVFIFRHIGASTHFKREIFGGIMFYNRQLTGTINLTYQALGGSFQNSNPAIIENFTRALGAIRWVTFDAILGLPSGFPPAYHKHDIETDLVDMGDVVNAVEKIVLAISNKTTSAADTALANHIKSTNAHSKSAVGLGKVQNYGVATIKDVQTGTTGKYVTADVLYTWAKSLSPDTFGFSLANYYTKNNIDEQFNNLVNSFNSVIADKVSTTTFNQALQSVPTKITMGEAISTSATTIMSAVNEKLAKLKSFNPNSGDFITAINNAVTTGIAPTNNDLNALKETVTTLSNTVSNNKTTADETFVTKAALKQGIYTGYIKGKDDNDTGLEWPRDGVLHTVVDSRNRMTLSPTETSITSHNGIKLAVQNDENLVLYNQQGHPIFASKIVTEGLNNKYDKTGGVISGAAEIKYHADWAVMIVNNTNTDGNIAYDGKINGVHKGGLQVMRTAPGTGEYETRLLVTPPGDINTDRRIVGMMIRHNGIQTHAYGWLHDYFVKVQGNQDIHGDKKFINPLSIGSDNLWGRIHFPLADGSKWTLETSPQYISKNEGEVVFRFRHYDDTTPRYYDLLKSNKNEAIAYRSWVETKINEFSNGLDNRISNAIAIGTVMGFPKQVTNNPGYLLCDGSTFPSSTYPDLFRKLGTNVLPNLNRTDVGQLSYFPKDEIPEGWLECNGQIITERNYPELYRYLGDKYGANGKLPNAEDRFIRNAGNGLHVGQTQKGTIGAIDGQPHTNVTSVLYDGTKNNMSTQDVADAIGADGILPNYRDYNLPQVPPNGNTKGVFLVWSNGAGSWSPIYPEGRSRDNSSGEVTAFVNRPKAIAFKLCIKAKNTTADINYWIKSYGTISNGGQLDAGRLEQDLRNHTHNANQLIGLAEAIKALTSITEHTFTLIPTHRSYSNTRIEVKAIVERFPDGRIRQHYHFRGKVEYFWHYQLEKFYNDMFGERVVQGDVQPVVIRIPLQMAMPNRVLDARISLSTKPSSMFFGNEAAEWAIGWESDFNYIKNIKDTVYFAARRLHGGTDEDVTFNIIVEGY